MSDISELMQRDPMLLTDEDTDEIILKLRQGRVQYNSGVKSAGSKKAAVAKVATPIDLVALGLMPKPPGGTT